MEPNHPLRRLFGMHALAAGGALSALVLGFTACGPSASSSSASPSGVSADSSALAGKLPPGVPACNAAKSAAAAAAAPASGGNRGVGTYTSLPETTGGVVGHTTGGSPSPPTPGPTTTTVTGIAVTLTDIDFSVPPHVYRVAIGTTITVALSDQRAPFCWSVPTVTPSGILASTSAAATPGGGAHAQLRASATGTVTIFASSSCYTYPPCGAPTQLREVTVTVRS